LGSGTISSKSERPPTVDDSGNLLWFEETAAELKGKIEATLSGSSEGVMLSMTFDVSNPGAFIMHFGNSGTIDETTTHIPGWKFDRTVTGTLEYTMPPFGSNPAVLDGTLVIRQQLTIGDQTLEVPINLPVSAIATNDELTIYLNSPVADSPAKMAGTIVLKRR
jgi:hypothetical protein